MKIKKILFVCLGNICRSPAAQGIMESYIKDSGMENSIYVDSAGTIAYHTGEEADPRMKTCASNRGYELTHRARKFDPNKDFNDFDYIIVMDNDNYNDIKLLDKNDKYRNRIYKMAHFINKINVDAVPDPYYLAAEGFENVLDILEDGCSTLLEKVKNEIG